MLSLRSPAKINLFLKILGKREDGYHELESLFQTIDLFDEMHFTLSENDRFTCSDASLPTDGKNLVIKARDLFREKSGKDHAVTIHLEKHIPHEAGLGGGSGNAATTLWALNQLLKTGYSDEQLMDWAAEIGSDVSFFLSTGSALCRGRGEKVANCEPATLPAMTLVKPPYGVSTPSVYACFRSRAGETEEGFYNDLEQAACEVEPRLKKLRAELARRTDHVLLSGSGTAFICFGREPGSIDGCLQHRVQPVLRSNGRWY